MGFDQSIYKITKLNKSQVSEIKKVFRENQEMIARYKNRPQKYPLTLTRLPDEVHVFADYGSGTEVYRYIRDYITEISYFDSDYDRERMRKDFKLSKGEILHIRSSNGILTEWAVYEKQGESEIPTDRIVEITETDLQKRYTLYRESTAYAAVLEPDEKDYWIDSSIADQLHAAVKETYVCSEEDANGVYFPVTDKMRELIGEATRVYLPKSTPETVWCWEADW